MDDNNDCLDSDRSACQGDTYPRPALSGSGMYYSWCERHHHAYLQRLGPKIEATRRRYPHSPVPPAWFDPMAIGERWDDED